MDVMAALFHLLAWIFVLTYAISVMASAWRPSQRSQQREVDIAEAMFGASVRVKTKVAHAVPIEHGTHTDVSVLFKPKFLEVRCETTNATGAACGCAGGSSGAPTARPAPSRTTRRAPTVVASVAPGAVDHAEVQRRVRAAAAPISQHVRRSGFGLAQRGKRL